MDTNSDAGGFPCREITELSGPASCGKTQLCYSICANTLGLSGQHDSNTMGDCTVVWLGCQGSQFRSQRLLQVAQKSGITTPSASPSKLLDRALVAHAVNTNHLFFLLEKMLLPKLRKSKCGVGVVVLDGKQHFACAVRTSTFDVELTFPNAGVRNPAHDQN